MLAHHPEIVLYQPEIPQNTGNIARLAAATGCRLHLIRPFGFGTADKNLRRPGLDYWPYLDLEIASALPGKPEQRAFFTKSATKPYTALPATSRFIVFGKETKGLPAEMLDAHREQCYKIPMFHSGVRSLNLANAVAIIVYHLLAQHYGGFHQPLPSASLDSP